MNTTRNRLPLGGIQKSPTGGFSTLSVGFLRRIFGKLICFHCAFSPQSPELLFAQLSNIRFRSGSTTIIKKGMCILCTYLRLSEIHKFVGRAKRRLQVSSRTLRNYLVEQTYKKLNKVDPVHT